MGTWFSASQQVEIATADSSWRTYTRWAYTYKHTCIYTTILPQGSPDFELQPLTNLYTWSVLQVGTAGEVCNVNNLQLPTMLCRIQKTVCKARQSTSPLIPVTAVLLTKVKLLKCFQEHKECYYLSIAVMYQKRLQADNISGTGRKDGRVNVSKSFSHTSTHLEIRQTW